MGGRVTERGANERTDYGLKPRVIGRALPGSNGRTERKRVGGWGGRKPPAPPPSLHRRVSVSSSQAQVRLFFFFAVGFVWSVMRAALARRRHESVCLLPHTHTHIQAGNAANPIASGAGSLRPPPRSSP